MTMSPALRKLVLTVHVACSVGWLGAVAAFLALALSGLTTTREETMRGAYLAMETLGWYVLVPSSLASLGTGVVQSLGTTWGLFRHYWVFIKLLLTVFATLVLLVHMQPVGVVARAAAELAGASLSSPDLVRLRIQLAADAAAALVVLLVATTLSVYKPRGLLRPGPVT